LLAATVPLWQNKSIPKQGGTIMLTENIKALRKTKGLTQDELAIRLNGFLRF
jgi:DNA-binding transcriptional regulator YiaG